MGCRAIIFDLDGTLLDTLDDITEAANSALRQMKFPEHRPEDYKVFVGEGMSFLAERALPEGHRDEATAAAWIARVKVAFGENWPGRTKPYEGIPELLDELIRRGMKMAILSNRPEELVKLMAREMLSRWQFDPIVGARENGPPKPNPDEALSIARALGVDPHACLFLGDSNVDMQAAAAAGMFPVGALWGFRSREELMKHGARRLIAHPLDLLAMI